MAVYISNLVAGLDKGLDRPELLLEMAQPFGGRVGIEFFIHTYSQAYMERMERIGEWVGALPLALHGPFLHVEATSAPGSDAYDTLTQAYERAFRLARRFGCGHMVFHDHERFVRPEQKQPLQAQCLENIETLIGLAKPWGVRLLLENLALPVKGTPLFDQEEYIGLFDRFPEADCLIDVGHLGVAGWDMEAVISRLAGRITGYHLHNNDGKNDSHRRIGDGVIDYSRFFELYRAYTPDADLTLEYGDNHGITAADVRRDVKYVMESTQGESPAK
ncbi:MAG: sugar phosphate isomerase/epimerase [Enterocloster asparagiformis]|nr:sugar phosphate isomerase/epimerase [Enterocloster asparagiformis]